MFTLDDKKLFFVMNGCNTYVQYEIDLCTYVRRVRNSRDNSSRTGHRLNCSSMVFQESMPEIRSNIINSEWDVSSTLLIFSHVFSEISFRYLYLITS